MLSCAGCDYEQLICAVPPLSVYMLASRVSQAGGRYLRKDRWRLVAEEPSAARGLPQLEAGPGMGAGIGAAPRQKIAVRVTSSGQSASMKLP